MRARRMPDRFWTLIARLLWILENHQKTQNVFKSVWLFLGLNEQQFSKPREKQLMTFWHVRPSLCQHKLRSFRIITFLFIIPGHSSTFAKFFLSNLQSNTFCLNIVLYSLVVPTLFKCFLISAIHLIVISFFVKPAVF